MEKLWEKNLTVMSSIRTVNILFSFALEIWKD